MGNDNNNSNNLDDNNSSNSTQVELEQLAINDYLEVINNEYGVEREKRQSFEARATLIMTILAAICVFIFGSNEIKTSLYSISRPLFFTEALKIILIIIMYLSFAYTIITTLSSVWVMKYDNIDFSNAEKFLKESRIMAKYRIFASYVKLIDNHRSVNKKKVKNLRRAFIGLTILLASLMIYSLL